MRITAKGQVTIPRAIRDRFGFLPGTEVAFRVDCNGVRLAMTARDAVSRLRASATLKLSTDEILALTRT